MAKESKTAKVPNLVLILFVLVGMLTGSIISEITSSSVPFLAKGMDVGLNPPATVDLYILSFTLGFSFKFNLGSAIGAILGYFIGKKMD